MGWRIKDWQKFQHYQDGKRKPDWIKVYRGLLDKIEWHELPAADAKTLVMLWLLASENGGELPCLKEIAFRLRITEAQAKSSVSRLSDWLEHDASEPLAEGYQSDTLEENRIEEKESGASAPLSVLKTILDDDRARGVLDHRKKLRKPLNARAAELLAAQLRKCRDPNAAADEMILRGWLSVKPEWLDRDGKNGKQPTACFSPPKFKPEPEIIKPPPDERERQVQTLLRSTANKLTA